MTCIFSIAFKLLAIIVYFFKDLIDEDYVNYN